jgi:DNA-binding HxlR family transcriptional regulator
MLTQQLRALEESKLINRVIYNQVPPKVEYSLTDYGLSLLPVLTDLCKWAIDYTKLITCKSEIK